MSDRIYLSPPHMSGEELAKIAEAFASNWIAPLGPMVDQFERQISELVGIEGTVALCSGTAAIHLALELAGVKEGDIVFCSSLTFVASVNPIRYLGAEPVFIDSEPATWNMSPRALERALYEASMLGQLPKAVIVVHLYGQCADMDAIMKICREYGICVIEDAAEAMGATYKGQMAGTIGDYGVYSFNGNKLITTSAGGALVSNHTDKLDYARYLAAQAKLPAYHYEHNQVGYNYRLSNILAAIGCSQLNVIDERIALRRAVFERYQQALGDRPGISFMPDPLWGSSTRWLTALTLDPHLIEATPLDVVQELEVMNIESRRVWKPMHAQPLYAGCRYYRHEENESVSDMLFERGICLPSGSSLAVDDQNRVIDGVQSALRPVYSLS
ncbi:aminotransferase class I/II-fold pyridoxal phosphate-dependent enzyme [Paenibacillus agilis]|uniref:Pyridoxal phosphate-dependent aminotransferase n=1 Tax=Paenibacillus agilis TaxID=3020863 RepID=A0A559IW15_9BACL|nr:aminotransferase class I/II-fold pyridoxal phosphate-dependent enzyme [Paenibacillus agilis]TVX91803.1 pyridoxal phosphate-dependent aminotransferase [Paenibacillus agilis]